MHEAYLTFVRRRSTNRTVAAGSNGAGGTWSNGAITNAKTRKGIRTRRRGATGKVRSMRGDVAGRGILVETRAGDSMMLDMPRAGSVAGEYHKA